MNPENPDHILSSIELELLYLVSVPPDEHGSSLTKRGGYRNLSLGLACECLVTLKPLDAFSCLTAMR